MNQSLTVREQHSPLWRYAAITGAVLAVVLFIIYWNMTDVFWSGILRLASFVSFAGAIMSGLKAMESGLDIEISLSDRTLIINYYKKGNRINEQSQELEHVTSIARVTPESRLSGETANVFIVRYKDSNEDFDLFHFSGRTLQFDDTESRKLIDFFNKHRIPFSEG